MSVDECTALFNENVNSGGFSSHSACEFSTNAVRRVIRVLSTLSTGVRLGVIWRCRRVVDAYPLEVFVHGFILEFGAVIGQEYLGSTETLFSP